MQNRKKVKMKYYNGIQMLRVFVIENYVYYGKKN
jgi:hypothetical protein